LTQKGEINRDHRYRTLQVYILNDKVINHTVNTIFDAKPGWMEEIYLSFLRFNQVLESPEQLSHFISVSCLVQKQKDISVWRIMGTE